MVEQSDLDFGQDVNRAPKRPKSESKKTLVEEYEDEAAELKAKARKQSLSFGGSKVYPVFFLLKILSRLISQPLSVIVNQSFEVGIFPNKLKVGKVNPLYKKRLQ